MQLCMRGGAAARGGGVGGGDEGVRGVEAKMKMVDENMKAQQTRTDCSSLVG